MFPEKTIRIGTRKSPLALAQSKLVGEGIKSEFPEYNIEYMPMSTIGDKRLDISLQEIGGKGVFTRELEEALLEGRIDLAVHSGKDLPLTFDKRLKICPVLKRALTNDVLILKKEYAAQYKELSAEMIIRSFAPGFKIGTSSKRRSGQILMLDKNIETVPIRGNILTRILKAVNGEVDALILAKAGLDRLGYDDMLLDTLRQAEVYDIPRDVILPAPAQGILCAEYADKKIGEILQKLQDGHCTTCFFAEREYLKLLQADCHTSAGIDIFFDGSEYGINAYFENKYANIENIKEENLFLAIDNLAKKFKNC